MPTPAALTILLFGLTALIAGLHGLIGLSQGSALSPEATANCLAAVAMGIYYPLAAYQENHAFFIATVPMRLFTTTVFWIQGWKTAAVWEGAGAGLTGLALLWSTVRKDGSGKGKRQA